MLGGKWFLWSKVVPAISSVRCKSKSSPAAFLVNRAIVTGVVLVVWVCLPGVAPTLRKERFPESTAEQGATGLMIQALILPLTVLTSSFLPKSCPCLGASPMAGAQPLGGFQQMQEAAAVVESNPSACYCASGPAVIYQGCLIRCRSFWDGPKLESISLNRDLWFLFVWDCWDHILIRWIQRQRQ